MSNLTFDLAAEQDENFFGALRARSNLGQLFGVDNNSDSEPQTLKYQPTKQPPTAAAQPTAASWQTLLAKVANAYREGQSVGKVGVALLQNVEGDCKLVTYKTKTHILATLSLPAGDSVVHLQRQSGYFQFYDDSHIYWSLRYDKEQDEQEFLQKLLENKVAVRDELPQLAEQVVTKAEQSPAELQDLSTTHKGTAEISSSEKDTTKQAHSKSQLISRMAKMGQQLPRFVASTECSDSSDAEVIATPLAMSHKPAIVPRNSNKLQGKTQLLTTTVATTPVATTMSVYGAAGGLDVATVNAMETQFLQMLLSENRTQNTELRMNLGKLEGKIEKVLDKMDCLQASDGSKQMSNKEDEILALEERLLELKKENRKLKQAMAGREQHRDGQMLQHIVATHGKQLQELDLAHADELETLVAQLLQQHEQARRKEIASAALAAKMSIDLEEHKERLARERELHAGTQQKVEELQKKVEELQQSINDMSQNITQLQTQQLDSTELQQQLVAQSQTHAAEMAQQQQATTDAVKTIMNSLYGNLVAQLEQSDHLRQDEVLRIIGRSIKQETLRAIAATAKPE